MRAEIQKLQHLFPSLNMLFNEPMSKHTSFRIGGPAECVASPDSVEKLAELMGAAAELGLEYIVIGKGSNILVSDDGVEGLVILSSELNDIAVDGEYITAGCGAGLRPIADAALNAGLSGLEFAAGIPGSLGGAVRMNAGAYGGEFSQVVQSSGFIAQDGAIGSFNGAEHNFSYRHSVYSDGGRVITHAVLKLSPDSKDAIRTRMEGYAARRREKQPLNKPSAGSVFKRPPNAYAAALIEECGLKGVRRGGARVSEKHAGFIVNEGGASCKDVLELIEYIRERVKAGRGVELDTEIIVIGR